ncbi:gluconate:H+ symporter [Oscillatoria sp. CS-180]|uniref:GntT/GntP/DsdX family permease n=1 Tax=Oscillatoria sp. CS-180 TaxID=3021720 RepID=UPI00232D778D|nr:gluconate:H+ symporter [Oscillatoria sp. CS-180]MDB9529266.1 gluconate:H+ symporter [Oscillatoria sp. CS-180]
MSTFSLVFIAVLGVALLLFLVIFLRLQAFIALLISSLVVAILGGIPASEIADTIQQGMGSTLGYIAIVIGVGAMFGEILQVSGGAEQIANTLVKRFGEDKAQWALAATGIIVAIPVFFDVALILFIPLVYSLAQRTGKSLLYYGIPLVAGIAVAHSFIPPTPGPVAVASLLGADLGWVILFGLIAGIPATLIGGIFFGKYISKQIHLDVPTHILDEHNPKADTAEKKRIPNFGLVVAIIAVPLVLILLNTFSTVLLPEDSTIRGWISFIGHPFTALIVAALLSFYFLGTRLGYSMREIQSFATRSLEPVGLIILVTGAGGVFGKVLVATGIGEALANLMAASNLPIILLAFLIATVVRVSQGSATVSMVTAAGLIAPAIEIGNYSAPLVGALVIAIASGATVLSHVNDSGFWLVGRFFGMDEAATFKSWTVMETILGAVGFGVVFVASFFL